MSEVGRRPFERFANGDRMLVMDHLATKMLTKLLVDLRECVLHQGQYTLAETIVLSDRIDLALARLPTEEDDGDV